MPKEDTKSKAKDVKEVKSKHNQATDKAGLSFNVNTTKNWMKKQFEVVGVDHPKFHGAHIGLTAIIESLLMSVLNHVNSHLPKDKSSLYKITLPALSVPLQLDVDYAKLFKDSIATFDVDTNYTEQFWMSKNSVNSFIESHYGDNIQVEAKAYNMICYLLLKYAVSITKTSHHLMTYAGKKTLEPKALRAAILIHTPDTVANTIIMKLDDAISQFSESAEDEEGEDDEKDSKKGKETKKKGKEESDDESEDEKETKKSAKGGKKEAKEVTDSESENDSESEDESESEEKPAPKATKKSAEKEDKKVKVKKNKD
jgi:hypothetical protein